MAAKLGIPEFLTESVRKMNTFFRRTSYTDMKKVSGRISIQIAYFYW